MPEFKPGDGAWKRVAVVWSHIDGHIAVNSEHGRDHYPVDESELLLPDVPHLDRIARYLAEHPETVEFIATAIAVVDKYDTTPYHEMQPNVMISAKDWDAIDCGISDGMRKRLHGFLRAMRGEAGK